MQNDTREYLVSLLMEADAAYTKAANDYKSGNASAEYYKNMYETWVLTIYQFIQCGADYLYHEKNKKGYISLSVNGKTFICNADNVRGIIGNSDFDAMFQARIDEYKEAEQKKRDSVLSAEKEHLVDRIEEEKRKAEEIKKQNEKLQDEIKRKEAEIEKYKKETIEAKKTAEDKVRLEAEIQSLSQKLQSTGDTHKDIRSDADPQAEIIKQDMGESIDHESDFEPDDREPDTPWLLVGKNVCSKDNIKSVQIPELSDSAAGNIFSASKGNITYIHSVVKIVKEKVFESSPIEFFVYPLEARENTLRTEIMVIIKDGDTIEPYVSLKKDNVIHAVFENYHFLVGGSFYQGIFNVTIETTNETKKVGCYVNILSTELRGGTSADAGHICFTSGKNRFHIAPVFSTDGIIGNIVVAELPEENLVVFDQSPTTEISAENNHLSLRTQWQGELFAVECVMTKEKKESFKEKNANLVRVTDNLAEIIFIGIGISVFMFFILNPDMRAAIMNLLRQG